MRPEQITECALELEEGRDEEFERLARAAFSFQVASNPVYRRFAANHAWESATSAPYLPIGAFKEAVVATFPEREAERIFLSSATGSGRRSRHFVRSLDLYRRALRSGFSRRFGTGPFLIVGHLPRYAEQGEASSLVYMVEDLVRAYGAEGSGFFLEDDALLRDAIDRSLERKIPLILFGAAFGLLDLLERGPIRLPVASTVIETGGMKTHRRDIGRDALHRALSGGFGVSREQIVSEYGMCELLSQCYSGQDGLFRPPPWVRCQVVDPARPEHILPAGQSGALAIFDLASIYTVCAVLTEDRAVMHDGGFEVQGRLSGAELRGCNFLVAADNPSR